MSRPLHHIGRDRAGTALPIFVIFLFVLMGLAALVIDTQVARLTQVRMQAVADMAALEGMRYADVSGELLADDEWLAQHGIDLLELEDHVGDRPAMPFDPENEEWQTWVDAVHALLPRLQANQVVNRLLDDPVNENRGLGPVLSFGVASDGQVQVADVAVDRYRPQAASGANGLELNHPDNDPNGDMLLEAGESLTIQIRRTGVEPIPGVKTSGPRIPAFFQMSVPTGDRADWPWPHHVGLSARAVSGTAAVRTVGTAQGEHLGFALWYLERDHYESFAATGATLVRLGSQASYNDIPVAAAMDPAGLGQLSIGDVLTPASDWPPAGAGYVALVDSLSSRTIQGFAWIRWQIDPVEVSWEQVGTIAPENASAIVRGGNDNGTQPGGPLQAPILQSRVTPPQVP